jgi:hypothetical protein
MTKNPSIILGMNVATSEYTRRRTEFRETAVLKFFFEADTANRLLPPALIALSVKRGEWKT